MYYNIFRPNITAIKKNSNIKNSIIDKGIQVGANTQNQVQSINLNSLSIISTICTTVTVDTPAVADLELLFIYITPLLY